MTNGFRVIDANGNLKVSPYSFLSLPVNVANGGTGLTAVAAGDLLYASGSNTLARLAIGSGLKLLTNYGGIPSWQDVLSGVIPIVPRSTSRKIAFSTMKTANTSSPTDTGWTTTGIGTVTAVTDASSIWSRMTSGIVIGNTGGIRVSTDMFWIDHAPRFMIRMRTGSITNVRYYFMISDTAAFPANSDDLHTSRGFGLRYSTVAGDAGWMLWSSDGTTQTIGAKVANIASNSIYTLSGYVDSDIGHFNCDINGISLNGVVPAGMLATTMRCSCCVLTQDTTAKGMDMSAVYSEWN